MTLDDDGLINPPPAAARQPRAKTARELCKDLVPEAVAVLERLLRDPEPDIALKAAIAVMNRAEGLPTQKVDLTPTLGPALRVLMGLARARPMVEAERQLNAAEENDDDDEA